MSGRINGLSRRERKGATMGPWDEIVCVIVLACVGGLAGYRISKLRRPFWLLGYVLPLILIGMVGASRWFDLLNFMPLFSWLMAGRTEFVMLAAGAMMLVMTLVPHLPRKREGMLMLVLFVIFVAHYTIYPFVEPLMVRQELEGLETNLDANGVCRQSTLYTCGPASAVTALHQLSIRSGEGQIAILARTCPSAGTAADLLCDVLQTNYGDDLLDCRYQPFRSVDELRNLCPVIVQIHYSLMIDHFITVLEVEGDEIVIGDPICGRVRMDRAEFEKIWRFTGITLRRR
jgi:hypothetical protein